VVAYADPGLRPCDGISWHFWPRPEDEVVGDSLQAVFRRGFFQYGVPAIIQLSVEANNAEWDAAFYMVQKEHSMNNSNGVYPLRLRQLRAIAENLCMLADRHREDHNYVVAYALYTRALSVAQQIHTPENDGNVLLARIRTDQQAAFDLLRMGEVA